MVKVLYINNSGGGFADYMDIEDGTTIDKFFANKMGGETPTDYLIRVNRLPVPRDYVLKEGDRITVTATKIEGA
jgi:sulfur carrier protein ThiS